MIPIEFYIDTTSSLFVGIASIGAVVVAWRGLDTWQKQLQGQTEYDLAKSLLVSTYKYRDAIAGVRHPAIWAYETPAPPDEQAKEMSPEQITHYGYVQCYQNRFSKVNTVREALYVELLEADALWGDALRENFNRLFTLETELHRGIKYHLEITNPATGIPRRGSIEKFMNQRRDVMYDMLGEDEDPFSDEFNAAITDIERQLRSHLKK